MATILIILLALFFLLVSAFYSGAEIVVTSVNHATLHAQEEKGNENASLMLRLLQHMEKLLATTLVGINITNILATSLVAAVINHHFEGDWESMINAFIMTPIVLIFAELVPKAVGHKQADKLASVVAKPLSVSQRVAYPLVMLCTWLGRGVSRLFGAPSQGHGTVLTREDLQVMAETAQEENVVTDATASMLNTVLELDERPVSAVMRPLVDIMELPEDCTLGDVLAAGVTTGHSRFPVYRERVDEIIGVIGLRDALYAINNEANGVTRESPALQFVAQSILFVPESKSVGALLHELRFQKVPMAMVVDEHGGVVGLITTEDLIEEVVGEIMDERDIEDHQVTYISDSIYECDGKLEIKELLEAIDIPIDPDDNEYKTVAGLVLKLAGQIPAVGDVFSLDGHDIEVLEMQQRRVSRVRLRKRELVE